MCVCVCVCIYEAVSNRATKVPKEKKKKLLKFLNIQNVISLK